MHAIVSLVLLLVLSPMSYSMKSIVDQIDEQTQGAGIYWVMVENLSNQKKGVILKHNFNLADIEGKGKYFDVVGTQTIEAGQSLNVKMIRPILNNGKSNHSFNFNLMVSFGGYLEGTDFNIPISSTVNPLTLIVPIPNLKVTITRDNQIFVDRQ